MARNKRDDKKHVVRKKIKMINEINKISQEISEMILKKEKKDDLNVRHIPFSVFLNSVEFSDNVLVFGLNPSSSDIDNSGNKNNCFVHYVPVQNDLIDDNRRNIISSFEKKGFTYNKYFKKPSELFRKFNYYPIWTNNNFLSNYKEDLTKEEYELLNSYKDFKKYLIFTDLINYKEKVAKRIENYLLTDKVLLEKSLVLFELQIHFFKPKLILINNAFASRVISSYVVRKKGIEMSGNIVSSILYKNTYIVFSAILTGSRAIDNYSYERLKKEISYLLNQNNEI